MIGLSFVSSWVTAAIAAATIQGAITQRQINVTLNGQPVEFENIGPRQVQGRVLVPLRGVLEQMGAQVGWDADSRTVTAGKSDLDLQMRIGSRSAMVNGQSVPLDVPAQIIAGTTMVPLRFISEALGASVQWVEATQTVQIDTAIASARPTRHPVLPVPSEQPTQENAISAFSLDKTGYLQPGTVVHFTLVGQPGGQASFQIPGATGDIPMKETQPGIYMGEWTVPATSEQGITMNETTALGHLIINGQDRVAMTGAAFSIDTMAPKVMSMRPATEGLVDSKPLIAARIDDSPGSGVDASSVKIMLDGQDITNQANVNSGGFSFRPTADLSAGAHKIDLSVADKAGNVSTSNWTFDVAEHRATPFALTFTPLPVYEPGKTIDVALDADPGATATLSIGNRLTAIPMPETSPGHYVAHYTIKEGDVFYNEPVVAHVKATDGKEFTIEAPTALGPQSFELKQPTLQSPKENEQVTSPLIIKGTAAPYSAIQIHIAYSALTMLNQIRVHGGLGDYSLTADQNGYFQTPAIDLDKIKGANKRFTVTVWAVDNDGKKSPVTTLNVSR